MARFPRAARTRRRSALLPAAPEDGQPEQLARRLDQRRRRLVAWMGQRSGRAGTAAATRTGDRATADGGTALAATSAKGRTRRSAASPVARIPTNPLCEASGEQESPGSAFAARSLCGPIRTLSRRAASGGLWGSINVQSRLRAAAEQERTGRRVHHRRARTREWRTGVREAQNPPTICSSSTWRAVSRGYKRCAA